MSDVQRTDIGQAFGWAGLVLLLVLSITGISRCSTREVYYPPSYLECRNDARYPDRPFVDPRDIEHCRSLFGSLKD